MKYLSVLLAVALLGCATLPPPSSADSTQGIYPQSVSNTVALQTLDGRTFCSGVVVRGMVMTAAHCVDDGAPFAILFLGHAYEGFVLEVWDRKDLALVTTLEVDLPSGATLAPGAPALGEPLFWLGYPRGRDLILGVGVVGNERTPDGFMAVYGQFIPGNSGGPVFNEAGQLIGIVSATMVNPLFGSIAITSVGYAVHYDNLTRMLT